MKVILLKNIPKLGEAGEIREVSDGYARNFLLAKNLVEPATEENVKKLELEKEMKAKLAEEDLVVMEKIAERLNGTAIEIKGRVNEEGRLYAAITAPMIIKNLKEIGFEVKKGQVVLPEPIKEAGEYPVTVTLDHGLEAEITVIVTE
ncbi:MAG: 50S ribosomal protein L9 [Patescibacteria group bacterium]